ncbi:MAG: aldo/keto reductase [Dactylosporangium sp.]|nr:aldo/keto reductase [Dactylosporangium sp.]NNJ60914.1 aldo/keto reductase [Dactylosporangium sp.]
MKTVQLGRTGEQISQLALGCMQMGTVTDEATSFQIIDRYVEAGGSFLDTADCYCWWERRGSEGGHSEELIGRWLASTGRREEIFLATKATALIRDVDSVWGPTGGPDWELARSQFVGAGADTLRRAIDASLRRLGTDHVDLYYVHVDDRATPLEETLGALAEIVRSGKARYIGWSNVRTWRMERLRQLCARHDWPAPVALQQQHSYLRRRAGLAHGSIVDDEQLDYLAEHDDLTLVAYSPILKGIYDDPAKRLGHPAMAPYSGQDAEARLAAAAEVAKDIGIAPNQLVISWLLHQQSPTVVPLIGPRTLEQFKTALAAVDVSLSAGQLATLDAAGAA